MKITNTITKRAITMAIIGAGLLMLPVAALAAPIINIQSVPTLSGSNGINYNIVITNTGDQVASDIFIRDTLAANESFISSILAPDISFVQGSQTTLVWHVDSINAGASYVITLNTAVNGNFPSGTTIVDSIEVEGLNFTTQVNTTSITTGAILIATPTPTQ